MSYIRVNIFFMQINNLGSTYRNAKIIFHKMKFCAELHGPTIHIVKCCNTA